MSDFLSNPRVTFNLVERDQIVGLEDHQALLVGQMTDGTASAGALTKDVPRTVAEINALFGKDSHIAMVARAFREINPYTKVDAIALEDAGGGTAATASIQASGEATAAASIWVSVVSKQNYRYKIDVEDGDDPADIIGKITSAINAGTDDRPFTSDEDGSPVDTITFTAANDGTIANDWLLMIEGAVPGISFTLTGWDSGATDPSLSDIFDVVSNQRYQTIVWPGAYDTAELETLLDGRKNVDNDVLEGRGFIYKNEAFATVKATAAALNSSEIVLLNNEPTSESNVYEGPHIPEAPDVLCAKFAAARALRFEDGLSITRVIATNAFDDQFGGRHTASLPYFNTPILNVGQPHPGTGHSFAEQLELEGAGVTVIGRNRNDNAIIVGQVVTTWLNDDAGNSDDTWKYLNWRDSHGVIREFFVLNFRQRFAQYRLSTGDIVPGKAIATQDVLRSYAMKLYNELTDDAITVAGRPARQYFGDNLQITLEPENRRAIVDADVPMVSQLGEILGSIKFSFNTA
ncbi:MAG: hypothetical protein ACLFU3_08550 [Dichotomicrobium sp.]